MADITNLLNQIKTAVKGEDVRGAIHDAIRQCYLDGSTSNTVDLEARDQIASIMSHMTGTPNEVLLYPPTENDIPPTYPSSASADTGYPIYGLMDFELNVDPSTFDFIRVYYQVVRQPTGSTPYNSAPIIFEFTADDFLNATSVISGYNYGTANQHLRIRRFDIKQDSTNYPPGTADNRKRYTVSNASYWTWDGDKGTDAVTAEVDPASMSESNVYPAGAILKIVGVKYADVEETLTNLLETMPVVTIDGDTLIV